MINFPFYNPVKKSISEYIKISNIISCNEMKERYNNNSKKNPFNVKYDVNFCDLSDFSSSHESDCDDDDNGDDDEDKNIIAKNNKYTRFFILSFIGTGTIISLSFAFYKIYILYRVYK
jgi:hypothetical protein